MSIEKNIISLSLLILGVQSKSYVLYEGLKFSFYIH